MKHALTLAVLATSLIAVNASAAAWTYTYTGNPFTFARAPFTTNDAIHFQFTSTGQIGANWNDQGFSAPIVNWSVSLGPLHYSSSDPSSVLYSINFSTNALNKIIGYQFTTQTDVIAPGLPPPAYPPTPYKEEVFSFNTPQFGVADGVYIPSIAQDSYYSYNEKNAGAWQISAVPEPKSSILLLAGLGIVSFVARRKQRNPT